MNRKLSIVITSYKNPGLLELCLDSLKRNIGIENYEIIVADGQTEEETYDLMREKFSDIIFIPNGSNVGFPKLVNQGIRASNGEFVFIINSDIIIKEDSKIAELIALLENNRQIGLVGPRLINFDGSIQPSCFRYYTPLTVVYRRTILKKFSFARKHLNEFLMTGKVRENGINSVDWLMGSALMTRKDSMEKVGLMDESFFMYFDDVDWCWRFWQAGYAVVYFPDVKVYHYHGKQSASQNVISAIIMNKYARIHISSAFKFFLKHFGKQNPRLRYEKMKKSKTYARARK